MSKSQEKPFQHYDGEERRQSPRDGEITDKQMRGALVRALKETRFTEGDKMRGLILSAFDRAMAASDDQEAPASAEDGGTVDEAPQQTPAQARVQKVRALFESPDAGYEGYALKMLRDAGIDPENLPDGSAPLWESKEAAMTELLSNLTMAHLEVIQHDYKEPAIAIEPIMASDKVYVKDTSGGS